MQTESQRTAIVVGATKAGIGEATARRLHSDGFRVVGAHGHLDDAAADSEIPTTQVDYTDPESIAQFISGAGPIDALVIADFFFEMEDPHNLDFNLWEKLIRVNLIMPNTLFHCAKKSFRSNASFVVVTSTEGFTGSFGASAYAASKAAMHNLVKSLANTSGDIPVRANAVAAGWIGGVMDTDEVFNMSRQITPLGRLGSPDEVAAAVSFLCGSDASFVNGSVLTVDGGYSGVDTISKFEYEASRA